MKAVAIVIGWNGAADEAAYGRVIAEELERGDTSKCSTAAVFVLTQEGPTAVLPEDLLEPPARDAVAALFEAFSPGLRIL